MIRAPWILSLALGFPVLAFGEEPRIELLAPSAWFSTDAAHVVPADLDQDGDLDLIHLASHSAGGGGDPHAYWIENLGSRRFAPLRLIHLAPTGVGQELYLPSLINLTGDALPELFVNRRSEDLYEPLALTPALSGPPPSLGTSLATAAGGLWDAVDLDGDNQGELIQVTMLAETSSTVRIFDRQADGSFAESGVLETLVFEPSGGLSVEAIDMDADGDRDLCFATALGSRLVFERTGQREFNASPLVFEEVYHHEVWTDLSGDGLPDLPYPDGTWQENLGGFEFQPREVSPAFALLESVAFKAISPRAGLPALVHAILPATDEGYELVTIPFDSTEPVSRQAAPDNFANGVLFLRYADLDGDGHPDLLHSYSTLDFRYYSSRILAVAWGSPAGLTAPQTLVAGPSDFHQVFPGDFNRDKCTDLIIGPDALGDYRIRFNNGNAGPGEEIVLNGLHIPGATMRLLGVACIDKDRCLDLVCNYTRMPVTMAGPESAIVVVRGRRDGSFVLPVLPPGGLQFSPFGGMNGEFVDWDRDGDLDLISGGVWRENVKGQFPVGQRYLVGLGRMNDFLGNPATVGGTITGDLDGDRTPDIISIVHGEGEDNQPPKEMLIAYNDGRGGIETVSVLPVALAAYDFLGNPTVLGAVAIVDLNADKLPDLWIREVSESDFLGNPVTTDRWLRNPGRGSRDPASWVSQPLDHRIAPGAAFLDFDGDRKPEWISPDGFLKPTRQGPLFSELFDFTGGIDLSDEPFRTGIDFDADGDADFVVGGGASPLLVLHNSSADQLKRRGPRPRAVRWLPLPPVR
jgi:hypothetical protein